MRVVKVQNSSEVERELWKYRTVQKLNESCGSTVQKLNESCGSTEQFRSLMRVVEVQNSSEVE
jgi:hypothetical protein